MSPENAARYTCDSLVELKGQLETMIQGANESVRIGLFTGGHSRAVNTLNQRYKELEVTEETEEVRAAIKKALCILQEIDPAEADVIAAIDKAKEDICILAYGGQEPYRI